MQKAIGERLMPMTKNGEPITYWEILLAAGNNSKPVPFEIFIGNYSVDCSSLTLSALIAEACKEAVQTAGTEEADARGTETADLLASLACNPPPPLLLQKKVTEPNPSISRRARILRVYLECTQKILKEGVAVKNVNTVATTLEKHLLSLAAELGEPCGLLRDIADDLLGISKRERERSVQLYLMADVGNNQGRLFMLLLDIVSEGYGGCYAAPELAFLPQDEHFRNAIEQAVTYVKQTGAWNDKEDVCWRINPINMTEMPQALKGPSAGLAFGLGLLKVSAMQKNHKKHRSELWTMARIVKLRDVLLSAEMDDLGNLSPVSGIDAKIQAAIVAAATIGRMDVVFANNQGYKSLERANKRAILRIKETGSLFDTLRYLTSLRRKEQFRGAVASVSACGLLMFVLASPLAHLRSEHSERSSSEHKPIISKEGNFVIDMPGNWSSPSDRRWISIDNGVTYSFRYENVAPQNNVNQFLTAQVEQLIHSKKDVDLTISPMHSMNVSGWPGKEFWLTLRKGMRSYSGRLFLVDKRLYQMDAEGENTKASSANANKFYDSFSLSRP